MVENVALFDRNLEVIKHQRRYSVRGIIGNLEEHWEHVAVRTVVGASLVNRHSVG